MSKRDHHVISLLAPGAIVLGCLALTVRPLATMIGLVVVLVVGAMGVLAPLPPREEEPPGIARWLAVVLLGVATFAIARAVATSASAPATLSAITATVLAAVAEETFFRRLVYGWLARWGLAIAIGGAAVTFAAVHIPGYGGYVLPLNLAAGILFGWQRWATGGWLAPALTHAAANLLQMG